MADANLGGARAALEQRRETQARLARQFDALLGKYPDGKIATVDSLPAVPPAPPVGLPAELLLRRPDVLASTLDLKAAGHRLTAAERSFLPSIELTGSAGTTSAALANLVDPTFFAWSIGGRLLQPVFQGGRLRAQVQLRAGERDEALQNHADTVLTALSEVETALAVEAFLASQEREFAAASAAAGRAMEIARNRYQVGKEPMLTLLESQRRLFDAQASLLGVQRARLVNRVDLHLALGGGFGSASGNLHF